MGHSNYVHLDAAVLVRYEDVAYWIPRSQIADSEEFEKGDIRTAEHLETA